MNTKQRAIAIWGGASALVLGGFGWGIHSELAAIEAGEQAIAGLEQEIISGRRTIESTPEKEREVIVLRELDPTFREILPSNKEVSDLLDTMTEWSVESDILLTGVDHRPAQVRAGKASDFNKASFGLSLEGDVFQFLDFLNRVETHRRFMAIPSFGLQSATRQRLEQDGQASHRIQLDVETYVYAPTGLKAPVGIDGYERKRDALAGEIARRKEALSRSSYTWRGPRGRRDPWVDPRVPVADNPSGLSVPEQNERVESLIAILDRAQEQWTAVQGAPDVLSRMLQRRELMASIRMIQDDLLAIDAEGSITFTPAVRKLEISVREPLVALLHDIDETVYVAGPTIEELQQVLGSMERRLASGEYGIALEAFAEVSDSLDLVMADPPRRPLAERLRLLAEEAEALRDFAQIELDFGGQALIQGKDAVVVLNGRSWTVGEVVPPGLEVLAIRSREVDFAFRGFVMTRQF